MCYVYVFCICAMYKRYVNYVMDIVFCPQCYVHLCCILIMYIVPCTLCSEHCNEHFAMYPVMYRWMGVECSETGNHVVWSRTYWGNISIFKILTHCSCTLGSKLHVIRIRINSKLPDRFFSTSFNKLLLLNHL